MINNIFKEHYKKKNDIPNQKEMKNITYFLFENKFMKYMGVLKSTWLMMVHYFSHMVNR